jgi:hypothetical protein
LPNAEQSSDDPRICDWIGDYAPIFGRHAAVKGGSNHEPEVRTGLDASAEVSKAAATAPHDYIQDFARRCLWVTPSQRNSSAGYVGTNSACHPKIVSDSKNRRQSARFWHQTGTDHVEPAQLASNKH